MDAHPKDVRLIGEHPRLKIQREQLNALKESKGRSETGGEVWVPTSGGVSTRKLNMKGQDELQRRG
jgi:hypothetical protein